VTKNAILPHVRRKKRNLERDGKKRDKKGSPAETQSFFNVQNGRMMPGNLLSAVFTQAKYSLFQIQTFLIFETAFLH
jgi:hypothetical protein